MRRVLRGRLVIRDMIFSRQERIQMGRYNEHHEGEFLQIFKIRLRKIIKDVHGDALKD